MTEAATRVLSYWFGEGNEADIPSPKRSALWFSNDPALGEEIREKFADDIEAAAKGQYDDWRNQARSSLALLLLLDTFPRKVFYQTPLAYASDEKAIGVCLHGLSNEYDHALSLMERVFYYMPLQHSEVLNIQQASIEAYQSLFDLSLSETVEVFKTFFAVAVHHYDLIQRFGRFPDRNKLLGRQSTPEEEAFLVEIGQSDDD